MYQIPPLANEYIFEDFICDLFNSIEKTTSFQKFGVKGQNQKGIDIHHCTSNEKRVVIQCKKKDTNRSDEDNRKLLMKDLETDLEKSNNLDFEFTRYILASTYKNDSVIQEYATKLSDQKKIDIEYWGWDTIVGYLEENKNILKKYYKDFKLDDKRTLFSINIWDENGKLGVDYSKLLLGVDDTIKNFFKNENATKNIQESIALILRSLDNEFTKRFDDSIEDNRFENFGFHTYLLAGIEQAVKSYEVIKERVSEKLNLDDLKVKVLEAVDQQRKDLKRDEYYLVFKPTQHPAVKFVKDTIINIFENLDFEKDLQNEFTKDFNDNIEKQIINIFGKENYNKHINEVEEKWLKDNEINFLIKMKDLSRIGFKEGESLKYQKTYGRWEDIKHIKFSDENYQVSNKDIDDENSLKDVTTLIDEYYENIGKENKMERTDHLMESILFIIADFGKGKSSLIRQYASELANKYLITGEGYFPIYFNLNQYGKYTYSSRLGVIGKYMETEYGIKLDDEYFKKKEYLFLIDSLDESGELSDNHINEVIQDIKQIHNIDKILCRNNRIIITSRPFEQGLRKQIFDHRPYEIKNKDGNNIPHYISVYGFKKEQFDDYVMDALKTHWGKNPEASKTLTGLSKEIYKNIISNNSINLYDKLLNEGILKQSELKRPIFGYMIYSLIGNNMDFTTTGKIGIYISFINQLTKDAKHKEDKNCMVRLKDEFKFRNILHATSALWQFKRQTVEHAILKKSDICRTLVKGDDDKTDAEVLSKNKEVEAIRFLSHSYLGEKDDSLHFQHQSFAEMLLAEYYLKIFIKYALDQNLDIEEVQVNLLLGIPTDQTIEFLEGLLELLKFCSIKEANEDVIEKRKLLAPLLASLATTEYCRGLFSDYIYHKWFDEVATELESNIKLKRIPNEYLENWPIKQKEIDKIVELAQKILGADSVYAFTKSYPKTVLFKKESIKIQSKISAQPPDMDKWLSLLIGNKLFSNIENKQFFNKKIGKFEIFFEMIKNWNYYSDEPAPEWGRGLFISVDMSDNKSKYNLRNMNFTNIDFSYSIFNNLEISFSNLHKNNFKGCEFYSFRSSYCHLYKLNFKDVKFDIESSFEDCIFVVIGPGIKFINFNINREMFGEERKNMRFRDLESIVSIGEKIDIKTIDSIIYNIKDILDAAFFTGEKIDFEKVMDKCHFKTSKEMNYFKDRFTKGIEDEGEPLEYKY